MKRATSTVFVQEDKCGDLNSRASAKLSHVGAFPLRSVSI